MKKLFFLFLFCFHLQAQELDLGVDIAYMNLTGLSTLNVFLIDVDNPASEPVQFTNKPDTGTCLEESDGSDEAFAACEGLEYPAYLELWQIDFKEDYFYLENLETERSLRLFPCEYDSIHCNYRVSSDGRWLAFNSDAGLLLADLADLGEAQAFPIIAEETYTSIFFWLDDYILLYWHNEQNRYFTYATETGLHYPLESVLDRETFAIQTEDAEGMESAPETVAFDESILPRDVRHSRAWAMRPDGSGFVYSSSDYELPAPWYCDSCAVAYWDVEAESSEVLFGLEDPEQDEDAGGWALLSLNWSLDGSRFIAGFTQINVYHRAPHFWLYEMETAERREVFRGDWAQWLR